METLTEFPEIDAAKDAARKVIDRLIDLTLVEDPSRGREAADALGLLRYRITEAAMAAFRRAETPRQRQHLLHVLDSVTFDWHFEAHSFLERVAHDDPDEDVRRYAEGVWQDVTGYDEVEEDLC
jgi:hypothetical protein